jgi:hypothetical protein
VDLVQDLEFFAGCRLRQLFLVHLPLAPSEFQLELLGRPNG